MRIISGVFKGKKISTPVDVKTRPLKDLTKESIFNILHHSNKLVFFVENYEKVLPILKKNLYDLRSFKNFEIVEKDIYKNNVFNSFNLNFDIIFLDPPYKDNNIEKILIKIKNSKILKKKEL